MFFWVSTPVGANISLKLWHLPKSLDGSQTQKNAIDLSAVRTSNPILASVCGIQALWVSVTFVLITCMGQNPWDWSHSTPRNPPRFVELELPRCESLPPVTVLNHINSFFTLTPCYLKVHVNSILVSSLQPLLLNILCISRLFYVCYMPMLVPELITSTFCVE